MPGHFLKGVGFIQGTGAIATVASLDLTGVTNPQSGLLFIGSMFNSGGGNLQRCQVWNLLAQNDGGSISITPLIISDNDSGASGAAFTFDVLTNTIIRARINLAAAWGISGVFLGSAIEHAVAGA